MQYNIIKAHQAQIGMVYYIQCVMMCLIVKIVQDSTFYVPNPYL